MYWLFVLGVYCLIATAFYAYLAMTAQDEPTECLNDSRIAAPPDWKRRRETGTTKVA
jgi:hypothetical protein